MIREPKRYYKVIIVGPKETTVSEKAVLEWHTNTLWVDEPFQEKQRTWFMTLYPGTTFRFTMPDKDTIQINLEYEDGLDT